MGVDSSWYNDVLLFVQAKEPRELLCRRLFVGGTGSLCQRRVFPLWWRCVLCLLSLSTVKYST
jgi:hypothetical protein